MFSDLANLVKGDSGSSATAAAQTKPAPVTARDSTASLLAKALAARNLKPGGGTPAPSTAQSTADGDEASSSKRKRDTNCGDDGRNTPAESCTVAVVGGSRSSDAVAADEPPKSAARTQPTKAEYEVQQRARLAELQAEITALIPAARAATAPIAADEFPDQHTGAHLQRKYLLQWIALLSGLWEQEVAGLQYERRFAPDGMRTAADFTRYTGQMRPVIDGLAQDVAAVEGAVAAGAEMPSEFNVPADIVRNLRDVFIAVARNKFLAVEEAYLRITMGSAAWHLGLFSGGNIHMRRNLDNIQKGVVKHVMNNTVARDFIQGVKVLTEVARRYQTGVLGLPWCLAS